MSNAGSLPLDIPAPVLRTVFAAWACFFVLFIIPLEFLFRVDAFLNYLPPVHILFNALFVMQFYLALACSLGFLASIAHAGLGLFRPLRLMRAKLVIGANVTVILFGFGYKLLNTSIVWASAVAKVDFYTSWLSIVLGVLSIAVAASVTFTRPLFIQRYLTFSQRTFRPILVTLGLGLVIIGVQIAVTLVGQSTTQRAIVRSGATNTTASRPNVILITLDALTAKDMSLYGYHLPTTPNLESFAKQSIVFDNAYANSNFTTPGITSILTSKYPITNKVYSYYNFLSPDIRDETLAYKLKQNGYETIALFANPAGHPNSNSSFRSFVHAPLIDHLHRLTSESIVIDFELFLGGLGFHPHAWFGERILAITHSIKSVSTRFSWLRHSDADQIFSRPTAITLNLAHNYLNQSSLPFFLWVHLQAPHTPYLPTAVNKYRFLPERILETESSQSAYSNLYYSADQQQLVDKLRLRYDEHIASVDADLGGFMDGLDKHGYLKNSIVIIAADHGEQFEKGYHEHGGDGYMGLYQPLIHIPLLIHLPGQSTPQRITANVEQVDIAPTILDLLRLPIPGWMEGESLKPALLGQPLSGKPKYSMNLELCSPRKPISDGSIAVMQGSDKYIYYRRSGKEDLFDLANDPQEEVNLARTQPEKARELNRLALQRLGLNQ